MRRLVIAVIVLALASAAQAGPLVPKHVAADAQWFGHINVEKIRSLPMLQDCKALWQGDSCRQERFKEMLAKLGMNPMEDLLGVTLYSTQYEGEVGACLFYVKRLDQEKMIAFFEEKHPQHEAITHGGRTLYRWTVKHHSKEITLTGTFGNETLIVIGTDTKHVRAALDVLDGKKDGLDKDSPLVAGVAKRALFVSRANNVPEAYRKTTKCPVLRNCSAAFAQWTENNGRITGKYRFITDTEETAQNYKAIVDGFMAMAKLRSGDSKAAMKVIDGLKCTAKGNSFRVVWKSTTDDVQAALGQMMKYKGGSRCGKKARLKDIVDTAVSAGRFKTLAIALTAADLVETLKGKGPFTVFAPTDEAFDKLPNGTLEELLKPENKAKLVGILTYHVVPGKLMAADVVKLSKAKTVQGSEVKISVKRGKVKVDGTNIVKTDIKCSNGVIHVIDAVLLPPPMSPRQARRTLEDAIRRGVPTFNRGDHRQCAEIYTTACQTIVSSAGDQVPLPVTKALKTALGQAKQEDDARSRAWTLRHGLNSALLGLRDVPPASSSLVKDKERLLFSFDKPEATSQWQTTNDGVMGGRSDGQFKINGDKNMEFFGDLSLANNGGFASIRTRREKLDLSQYEALVFKVRGDGRTYYFNIHVPTWRIAFSYRAEFTTEKDKWKEIRIPLKDFQATSFGRKVAGAAPLDAKKIQSIGFMLSDKKAGPFKLEVAWIKGVSKSGK